MRHLVCIVMLTGVGVCIGCGHKSGLDGVVAVTGTVTYQGKPIDGASVAFSPDGKGRAASGRTDATGRFQLTTLDANDGALPGKYKVAISKVEVENAMTADQAMEWFKKNGGPPPGGNIKNRLPDKYKDANASGQTAEVVKGGENDFSFKLD